MSTHLKQLPIPNPVSQDNSAIELIRVWAGKGKQHISLASNIWEDPAAWGILLVDLAKHISSAYEQSTGADQIATLNRIKDGFDAEWQSATDIPRGELR